MAVKPSLPIMTTPSLGRTMDDQQITVCIPTAHNTYMAVI